MNNCLFQCTLYLSVSLSLFFLYLSARAVPSAWKARPLSIYLHELYLILHISAQLSLSFQRDLFKAHLILSLADCLFSS